jgi:nucleotide-binding universal stress UspA family protein
MEFKHILCAIDLSDSSSRVIAYAAAVTSWFDARLTILHVVPTSESVLASLPLQPDELIEQMRRLGAGLHVTHADFAYTVEAGDPAVTIIDQAVGRGADLVAIGTHGRRGFDRLLLGSVAERVLRKAPCPILTVPPHAAEPPSGPPPFQRILCPIDFSARSLQAFGFALALARRAGGMLTLLHAIEWLAEEEEPRTHTAFEVSEYLRHLVEQARGRLDSLLAAETTAGCEVEPVVVVARAYKATLETASERQADLIVMGAQGRGAVGLALFGSTTQHVLRGAECPVLTVHG